MNNMRPEDARALFQLFREELSRSVAGHRQVIDRIALLATRAMLGDSMIRALLIGPPGVGKTSLARRVAELLDVPFLEFSAAHLSEEGWKGAGPSEHLAALLNAALVRAGSLQPAQQQAERAMILIDELDKTRLPGSRGSTSTRKNRMGKQLGLLNLVGDGAVTIDRGSGQPIVWRSRHALVLAAGVFEGLGTDNPSAGDLIEWGLIPELSERLARGTILRMNALSAAEFVQALRIELEPLAALFKRFGHRLSVSDATLGYVARYVLSGDPQAGLRAAAGWIEAGAERRLLDLLRHQTRPAHIVLGPDDVDLPAPPRPHWRE